MAETQDQNGAAKRPDAEAPGIEGESTSFGRCATCRHGENVDIERGTLRCRRHVMLVDADADEIPDDCVEYERDPDKKPPPNLVDAPVESKPPPKV
ncbi:MAG TPA: hypothetical protein P5137_15510 [Candidatus Brocadiia bacterium]|nr:hypothetical protein [Candidatus Brocadiia bacterium]